MAIGLGKLFQDMLKIGVADAAKKNIPDMVGRMFAKQEPTTDEVLKILEDERKQRAAEFVGGGQLRYDYGVDDAPNIFFPEPMVSSTTGSIIPQQTIVPQIVEAPRGTVVRNLGSLFLEVERINANIAAVTKAMRDSASLEKKYRDELIKSREQALSMRDKFQSLGRAGRGADQNRSFFGRQLEKGKRRVQGMTQGFLEATLFSFALEIGGMVVNAIKNSMKDPPGPPPPSGNLRDLISRGEGNLNSVNRGVAGDTPDGAISVLGRNLTDMTVDEVFQAQKDKKISAAGKYQIIEDSMEGFQQYLTRSGVDTSTTKFDKETQDKYFDYVVAEKRPLIGEYLKGGNVSLEEAILQLAMEFAVVGVPYAIKKGAFGKYPKVDIKRGDSFYTGESGNAASLSPETLGESLLKVRNNNIKSKQGRRSPQNNRGQGGGDGSPAMPNASEQGAPGIPNDPNAPKIGDTVGAVPPLQSPSTASIASLKPGPDVQFVEYPVSLGSKGGNSVVSSSRGTTTISNLEPKPFDSPYFNYLVG